MFENVHDKKVFKTCFPQNCVSCRKSVTHALVGDGLVMLCDFSWFVFFFFQISVEPLLTSRSSWMAPLPVTEEESHSPQVNVRVPIFTFPHENKVHVSRLYGVVARMTWC